MAAVAAFTEWDGEGDPADGWVRAAIPGRPGWYRRRTHGDPSTEHVDQ